MLRLPATSISLSEKDLSFHLQQIDIYHGLLKHGFKPAEIKKYFDEAKAHSTDLHDSVAFSPDWHDISCVELASKGRDLSAQNLSPASPPPGKAGPSKISIGGEALNGIAAHEHRSTKEDHQIRDDLSPVLQTSRHASFRHAPRQSSLLRFAEAISPVSTANEHAPEPKSSSASRRMYRPRTNTYSYTQSEVSDSDINHAIETLQITSEKALPGDYVLLSSALRPEAASFIPARALQHSLSHETQVSLPFRTSDPFADHAWTSVSDTTITPTAINESPVLDNDEAQGRISSPLLPPPPIHPTPTRSYVRTARTEPRVHNHQYLDGEAFSVYNDSLPAASQPQTPADLSRQPLLTEYDAAYTAPPGRFTFHSPSRSQLSQPADTNEQTPIVRAIGIRERRARELTRGARAEVQRLQRLRVQDRDDIARGFDGNEGERNTPGRIEQWRDDLEGDRVGEENVDPDFAVVDRRSQEDRIRVVSGNAQRALWD